MLKNRIDDYEEDIRKQKAVRRHLMKGARLERSSRDADRAIRKSQDAIDGCRWRKNKYMEFNRKLRNRTPLEKYMTVFQDDREVIVLDDEDD